MSLRSIAIAGALVFASGLAFTACGKQSEAMRCEVDDDCDTNLKCSNVGFADKICCPSERTRSTTSECKNGPSVQDTGVAETTPVIDTGTPEVAADTMMAGETAVDTGADSGTPTTDADAGG